ncbi:MAG: class I SAM-dependent methyltransferase [bacterium]|nr:class I SAM-dependent methyltransferase [bacterium]
MADMQFSILTTKGEKEYELLDSGEGEKLERFGKVTVRRPDPQALWKKMLPHKDWDNALAQFIPASGAGAPASAGRSAKATWKIENKVSNQWQMEFADLKFWIKPTSFKHVGIFPEQKNNWEWIRKVIKDHPPTPSLEKAGAKIRVLNLFGYTGGATLAAAQVGAEVVHVDGSKTAIVWGRENALISELNDMPIRWIVDDVLSFVKREIKRGSKYDGIIMDPPAFGRGSKGEVWKIEENLLELLDACRQLLSEKPLFFLVNGYASGYSAIAYKNTLETLLRNWQGTLEVGELSIEETKSKRLLPAGIFARWKSSI